MIKFILYDYKDDVEHYILVEPYKDGFHFAFGITHCGDLTFTTKWSAARYRTENLAILAANRELGSFLPSLATPK